MYRISRPPSIKSLDTHGSIPIKHRYDVPQYYIEFGFCKERILKETEGVNQLFIFDISGGDCPESAEVHELR